MLSEAEIAVRRPVWVALSELWLDSVLQDRDLTHIARVLRDSGYDRETLEAILFEEVAPVVYRNLYSVAGEWMGFDEDWLCGEIRGALRRRGRLGRWLLRCRRRTMIRPVLEDWQEILRRHHALAEDADRDSS